MDAVVRAAVLYFVLVLVFRVSGKRSLSQITTFDFILLLIISEATQQALLGDNFSLTNALLSIITLTVLDIGLAMLKQRFPGLDKALESTPLVVVEDGRPIRERMMKSHIDEADILTAARERQGLERMEQIKYAVLERSGGISIIPQDDAR